MDNKLCLKLWIYHMRQVNLQTWTVPNYCKIFLPLDRKRPCRESGLKTMVYYCMLYTLSLWAISLETSATLWRYLLHRFFEPFSSVMVGRHSSLSCRHWVANEWVQSVCFSTNLLNSSSLSLELNCALVKCSKHGSIIKLMHTRKFLSSYIKSWMPKWKCST